MHRPKSENTSRVVWNSHTYLLDVVDQRVAVLIPVVLERVLIGELVTAELQSDLKAVAAEVVEILHSCNWSQREGQTLTRERGRKQRCCLVLVSF